MSLLARFRRPKSPVNHARRLQRCAANKTTPIAISVTASANSQRTDENGPATINTRLVPLQERLITGRASRVVTLPVRSIFSTPIVSDFQTRAVSGVRRVFRCLGMALRGEAA